jgi:hypothetical protein
MKQQSKYDYNWFFKLMEKDCKEIYNPNTTEIVELFSETCK